ncbi:TPA: DUF551 domain-containing protein [Klebsiella pneumoniae]
MTKSTITRERIQRIIRAINSEAYDEEEIREWLSSDEIMELSRMALAAMDSESWCLPLDYLQGHKDGLEWASQLAEANHPETGDWLYDDPIELAKAIRKGPDMPPVQPVEGSEPDRNPVLAYADSYRDMAKQGVESVPIWSVITDLERNIAPLYRHAQPAVDSDFIPKNLDKALGVVGVAIPESREEFNLQAERWIQRLIDRVIRYADEFQEQPEPVVPAVSDDIGEIRVGRLPTMNQDDYPGLGDWWVQLRIGEDSDEVLARVYGATPQEANNRAEALACRAAMLHAGNSPAQSDCCPAQNSVVPAQSGNSPAIPDGYVLVPKEATKGILDEFDSIIDYGAEDSVDAWHRLLAAAPQSPGSEPATVPGKWIPVSEQMPEDRTQVILWDAEIGEVTSGHYSHKTHTFYHCGDAIENEITHWMAPPAAPQEVSDA